MKSIKFQNLYMHIYPPHRSLCQKELLAFIDETENVCAVSYSEVC